MHLSINFFNVDLSINKDSAIFQENYKSSWIYKVILVLAIICSFVSTLYYLHSGELIAYGDAESHINIAKRVISNLTPGMAQLGGIWLPLPHLLMVPFVYSDFLWRTGLAGAIVSGTAFIISAIFLYKLTFLITRNALASFFTFFVFILNPNILYMQSTPMTEMPLIAFFILSSYFFIKFLRNYFNTTALISASFFAFCASLSRYDGWFLVLVESCIIALLYIKKPGLRRVLEGRFILFVILAFFGILLWFLWDLLILGNPFYFLSSPYSANAQQNNWLQKGELPAYHNVYQAILYYSATSMSNIGLFLAIFAVAGCIVFLLDKRQRVRSYTVITMLTPFIFYVVTLYIGQSVIFLPSITPSSFEWTLFNVRYGMIMIPAAAFFLGFLFFRSNLFLKSLLILSLCLQTTIYIKGFEQPITLLDGTVGLSAEKTSAAESWFKNNYHGGLVLLDDYARTISVVRSGVPMQDTIYIGNKPYWQESLKKPEKYATWIIIHRDDALWNDIYENKQTQERLYKYFTKVYTSPDILIFRRNQKIV